MKNLIGYFYKEKENDYMKQCKFLMPSIWGILLVISFLISGCAEGVAYEETCNLSVLNVENVSTKDNIVWECSSLDVNENGINDYAST